MSVAAIAEEHQSKLIRISNIATDRSLNIWKQIDFDALDTSWNALAPALLQQSNGAQLAAAKTSDAYMQSVSKSYGFTEESSVLVAGAFVGVDGSGRDMESLLHGAVTTTKTAVGAGLSRTQSLEAGAAYLAAMLKTGLADLARSADLTSATGKGYIHYMRVVNPGACSRCAILAGKSSYAVAFQRHPACRCTTAPLLEKDGPTPAGLSSSPEEYFDSLTKAEQDRIFTKSGAEAIRSGANPITVVSARRGASGITSGNAIGFGTRANSGRRLVPTKIGVNPDGSPIMGYTTVEGTSKRGVYGRTQRGLGVDTYKSADSRISRVTRVRLMPESIVSLTDDLPTRQMLLRDAGYLDYPVTDFSNNSWVAQQKAQQIADRKAATEFYASRGIFLG